MVRLTRIYTRGGDGGETSLGDGVRVKKHDLRVEAFGTVDEANAAIKPLDSFVLPGGTACAAYLHLARTITRRAERLVAALAARESVNPEALKYLNRLSDHLFVLGRHVNDKGARDVLWTPGANR